MLGWIQAAMQQNTILSMNLTIYQTTLVPKFGSCVMKSSKIKLLEKHGVGPGEKWY